MIIARAFRANQIQRIAFLMIMLVLTGILFLLSKAPPTLNKSSLYQSLDEPFHHPPVIIVVPSARRHFAYRNGIRKTWGNHSFLSRSGTTTNKTSIILGPFFFIGASEAGNQIDDEASRLLAQESAQFRDIVNVTTVEKFRLLTPKMFEVFTWVRDYLNNRSAEEKINFYILKTDDDAFVNVHEIFRSNPKPAPRSFYCRVIEGGEVVRKRASKLYVSNEAYVPPKYPTYCSGIAYIFPAGLLDPILKEAAEIKKKSATWPHFTMPSEDTFFTGAIAKTLQLTHTHFERTVAFAEAGTWRDDEELCSFGSGRTFYFSKFLPNLFANIFNQAPHQVIHRVSPREMAAIHKCVKWPQFINA